MLTVQATASAQAATRVPGLTSDLGAGQPEKLACTLSSAL